MSEPLYVCACEQFYYGVHHEECPARRQYEALRERFVELEAKEKRGCVHNDLVYLEEVIARRNERISKLEAQAAKDKGVAEAAIPAADSYENLFSHERDALRNALREAGYLKEQGDD